MIHKEDLEPFYNWLEYNYKEGEVGKEGTKTWDKAFGIWEHERDLHPFYTWLEDNYDEYVEAEGTDSWNKAFQAFENYELEELQEFEWYLSIQTQKGMFDTEMRSIIELLNNIQLENPTQFSLLVMLHGHTVAAVESYLASTFIHKVINSDELIKKLVETDPVFSKMKFTLKEIFEKQKSLKVNVVKHLRDIIFHDLKKVKPMYKNVLDCDFGNIKWLYKAVGTRHDCVHRAGLNKDGKRINVSADSIHELVDNSNLLIQKIENSVQTVHILDSSIFST